MFRETSRPFKNHTVAPEMSLKKIEVDLCDFKTKFLTIGLPNQVGSVSRNSRIKTNNSIFNISKNDMGKGHEDSKSKRKSGDYPCTLAFYVLPVFCVMYWLCLIPNKIQYDPKSGTFVKVSGAVLRKICCLLVNLSTLLYLSGALKNYVKISNGSAMAAMYEVMFVIFIFLCSSIYFVMWTRMDNVAEILTNVTEMTIHFESCGIKIPASKQAKAGIWALLVIHLLIAMAFAIIYKRQVDWNGSFVDILYSTVKDSAITGIRIFPPLFGYNIDPIKVVENVPKVWVTAIGLGYNFVELSNHVAWILADLLVLLWGFMFRKLFVIFFLKMESNKFMGGNILEDIRDFNSLTMLVDKFNCTFGPMTFFIVLGAIIHTSVQGGQMVTWDFNKDPISFIILVFTFMPFFGMILGASLVHDLANDFTVLIKQQFNHQNGRCWTKTYGNNLEVSQGLSMVYYDLQSNAVGFKGFGFFTVSYSFIGSVLSVIATYAVVALQFTSDPNKT